MAYSTESNIDFSHSNSGALQADYEKLMESIGFLKAHLHDIDPLRRLTAACAVIKHSNVLPDSFKEQYETTIPEELNDLLSEMQGLSDEVQAEAFKSQLSSLERFEIIAEKLKSYIPYQI